MPQGILHLGKVEHVNTKKVSKGPRLVNPIRLTTLTITSHTMLPLQSFNKALKTAQKNRAEKNPQFKLAHEKYDPPYGGNVALCVL